MAEPALILSFCGLAYLGGADTVSGMVAVVPPGRIPWRPEVILLAGTMFLLLLAENARIPVDDPATHLELTMIHEAMVLDHAGVDLAMIQLASGVRLVLFSALVSGTIYPEAFSLSPYLAIPAAVAKVALSGVLIGATEAGMARMRLSRITSYLLVATVLAAIALAVRFAG
jgi:formate hydrogenlyase subunit 4